MISHMICSELVSNLCRDEKGDSTVRLCSPYEELTYVQLVFKQRGRETGLEDLFI